MNDSVQYNGKKKKSRLSRHHFMIVFLIAMVAGITIAAAMMYIALEHNPMGEYCTYDEGPNRSEECIVQWGSLGQLGIMWFAVSFTVFFILFWLFALVRGLWGRP